MKGGEPLEITALLLRHERCRSELRTSAAEACIGRFGLRAFPVIDQNKAAKPMWGPRGRQDLQVIRDLGANAVRLYGNNPNQSHRGFLDEAHQNDLQVIPGASDFPYTQMYPGRCLDTDFDCFDQIRGYYASNLAGGFLTDAQEYHPALRYFILVNEPDLKLPGGATVTPKGPERMVKAIVSALDGALEAEKEANISGPLINFTATFSYAICLACDDLNYTPGLGQMAALEDGMLHPERYGYEPRNNVSEAYRTRWTHSFNTNNPARDLEPQFFSIYGNRFSSTPVFIGEYHNTLLAYLQPPLTLAEDLAQVLDLADSTELFLGISFFQFQVAYWKGGSEELFGLFGLGHFEVATMPYYGHDFKVWCLVPRMSPATPNTTLPAVLTEAYGGPGIDTEYLCQPSPDVVPLTQVGFAEIAAQGSAERLAAFARRVVQHLGAEVNDEAALVSFADQFLVGSGRTFSNLVVAISYKPAWATFSADARCVADPAADAGQVGQAISWLCGHAPANFSCEDVPASCAGDAFSTGDWLFSRWYRLAGEDPLQDCNFGGAALFASPALLRGRAARCSEADDRRLGEVLV
ncbi:TDP1 [Symbiodinium natans]|uniref:TDP1 protein n=1 Tax=Symbiodinium natans TaxID=878477 RepID=A0A812Q6U4_9DINO|nr:TDP1 [Symbiodinium natans]